MSLKLKVGNRVQDCDPRSRGAVKEIVGLDGLYARVAREGVKHSTKVRLDRIHNKPASKKGYLLLPTLPDGVIFEAPSEPTDAEPWDDIDEESF